MCHWWWSTGAGGFLRSDCKMGDVAPQCAEDAPSARIGGLCAILFQAKSWGRNLLRLQGLVLRRTATIPAHHTFHTLGSFPWAEFLLVGHHGGPEPVLDLTCHKDLLFLLISVVNLRSQSARAKSNPNHSHGLLRQCRSPNIAQCRPE